MASRASIPSFSLPEGLSNVTHTLIARPQAESVGAVRSMTLVAENCGSAVIVTVTGSPTRTSAESCSWT